ncbi:AbiV family abortive infection protein [Qipengyuania flava]|nr:AbiV family abortive infection protein [Qipengyuania flava]
MAAEGIALARKNAARLIADAELLLENERLPSAAALAILAIEELGKVQIIKRIVLHSDDAKQLKEAWKEYRSHRAKNVMWILPKLVSEGATTMMQLRQATEIDGDHTAMLDSVKQLSFYTDCFTEKARWSEPGEAVDAPFAPAILATARLLNRETATSERELELWVEYLAPHYAKPTMGDALLAFQRRLFDEGLTSKSPETLEAFVRGTPVPVTKADKSGSSEDR